MAWQNFKEINKYGDKIKNEFTKSSINILTLFYYLNNLNVSYLFKETDASEMEKNVISN